MGYKPPKKTYKLKFENPDRDGLEVYTKPVSLGEQMHFAELSQRADNDDLAAFEELLQMLAGNIESWNLEDDEDQPMPVSVESLKAQERNLVLEIIEGWFQAQTGVPAPLSGGSTSGDTSQVVSIPMETL
jgi:hypothetical protein